MQTKERNRFWNMQVKARRLEEALAFGRESLGPAVKTSEEHLHLQV